MENQIKKRERKTNRQKEENHREAPSNYMSTCDTRRFRRLQAAATVWNGAVLSEQGAPIVLSILPLGPTAQLCGCVHHDIQCYFCPHTPTSQTPFPLPPVPWLDTSHPFALVSASPLIDNNLPQHSGLSSAKWNPAIGN